MISFRILKKQETKTILPLVKLLNSSIDEKDLASRLEEMLGQGYQCAGAFDDLKLIGICGIWIQTKFYSGKFIEPDNVYVLEHYRSKGVARDLLSFVYEYGKAQGCVVSELNCYIENEKGLKFWDADDYKKLGYHLQKKI